MGNLGFTYRADLKPPSADYTFSSATNLPTNLQLRGNSIVGTPTSAGLFRVVATAVSSINPTPFQQAYNLVIRGLELVVSGETRIYKDQQSVVMMIVRGGIAPIKVTIESGPTFCQLQGYQMYCMPSEIGTFNVNLLVTDSNGSTLRQIVAMECISNPNVGLSALQKASTYDSTFTTNSNTAHNTALKSLPGKCKLIAA